MPTPTRTHPSFQSMPRFAGKFTEVADVATYIRNSWGNRARPVNARKVAGVRSKLNLAQPITRDHQ